MKSRKITLGKVDLIVVSLIFSLSLLFYIANAPPQVPTSNDEFRVVYAIANLREYGHLNFFNELNTKYHTCGFFGTDRSSLVFKSSTEVYPTGFIGSIIFYYLLVGLFGPSSFYFITPFFAAVGLSAVYFLTLSLSNNRRSAILASCILFSSLVYAVWSFLPIDSIPTFAFFAWAIYFLNRFNNQKQRGSFLDYSGFFFASAVLIRINYLLYVLPFIFWIYLTSKSIKNTLRFLFPTFLALLLVGYLNFIFFKDAFFVGYNFINYNPCVPSQSSPEMSLDLGYTFNLILNQTYLFLTDTIFFPLVLFSIVGLILFSKNFTGYSIFSAFVLSLSLLVYGAMAASLWGHTTFALDDAYFRYLLPVYGVLSVFAALFLTKLLSKVVGATKQQVVWLLLIIIFLTAPVSSNKFKDYTDYTQEYRSKVIGYKQTLVNLLEPDSVILAGSTLSQSYLYPQFKNIFWYVGMPKEQIQYRYSETGRVLDLMLDDKRTVYFMYCGMPYCEDKDMFDFLNSKYRLVKVSGTDFSRMQMVFYKVASYKNSTILTTKPLSFAVWNGNKRLAFAIGEDEIWDGYLTNNNFTEDWGTNWSMAAGNLWYDLIKPVLDHHPQVKHSLGWVNYRVGTNVTAYEWNSTQGKKWTQSQFLPILNYNQQYSTYVSHGYYHRNLRTLPDPAFMDELKKIQVAFDVTFNHTALGFETMPWDEVNCNSPFLMHKRGMFFLGTTLDRETTLPKIVYTWDKPLGSTGNLACDSGDRFKIGDISYWGSNQDRVILIPYGFSLYNLQPLRINLSKTRTSELFLNSAAYDAPVLYLYAHTSQNNYDSYLLSSKYIDQFLDWYELNYKNETWFATIDEIAQYYDVRKRSDITYSQSKLEFNFTINASESFDWGRPINVTLKLNLTTFNCTAPSGYSLIFSNGSVDSLSIGPHLNCELIITNVPVGGITKGRLYWIEPRRV